MEIYVKSLQLTTQLGLKIPEMCCFQMKTICSHLDPYIKKEQVEIFTCINFVAF